MSNIKSKKTRKRAEPVKKWTDEDEYELNMIHYIIDGQNQGKMFQLYDQAPVNKNKKTLLPCRKHSQNNASEEMVDTVETVFEIYLCDNCEAELYSKDAYDEHEKTCQEDDDVIFCGEEFQTDPIAEKQKEQSTFLQNFALSNSSVPHSSLPKTPIKKNNNEPPLLPNGKRRQLPRRSRHVVLNLAKCGNIPFSSPAGQQIIKLSKSSLGEGYIQEKLERTDRYCCAPPLGDDSSFNRPKFMCHPVKYNRVPVTFRRPQDYTYRWYKFPRRQNDESWRRQAFLNLNINELKVCKPVVVKLKRLTNNDIEAFHLENSYKQKNKLDHPNKVRVEESDLSNVVDVIDLCSSDDEEANELKFFDSPPLNQDIGNVSQTAITPASEKSPIYNIEPLHISMYNETTSQTTMSMFNPDDSFEYQNQESHRSFLNGAQGSIVSPNGKLIFERKDMLIQSLSPVHTAHISIDLT